MILGCKWARILSIALSLVEVMGGTKRPGSTKYKRLRAKQDKMMDHYADGNMDLYTYQLSMGALSFSKNSRFFGDENEEQLIANICSETDLMLSEININIDNSLLKIVNCRSPSPKKTKKPSKSVKHRRQKPNEDPRISILNIRSPVRGVDHDSDSLHGEQLRQNRLMGDPTTAAVLAVATAAAASTATCEDSDDQSPPSPSQPTLPPPSLPTPLPASQPTPPSLSSTDMFDTV